jgi:hypothetical protein
MNKVSQSWVDVLILYVLLFGVVYLTWCNFVMDPTASVYQILCKSRKKWDGDPDSDQTSVWGREHETYMGVWLACSIQSRPNKGKSRACSSFSLTWRRLFTKNLHTTVMIYGDCMKMCEDFVPNYGNKRTGCCIPTTLSHTSFFTREIFTKSNMTLVPHPPYFSLFTWSKIKLSLTSLRWLRQNCRQCLTSSQHDFQGAFKKWQKCWEQCIRTDADYFEDDGGQ